MSEVRFIIWVALTVQKGFLTTQKPATNFLTVQNKYRKTKLLYQIVTHLINILVPDFAKEKN